MNSMWRSVCVPAQQPWEMMSCGRKPTVAGYFQSHKHSQRGTCLVANGMNRRQTHLSILAPAFIPLIDAFSNELNMWTQEFGFYRRRLQESMLPMDLPNPATLRRKKIPPIDADFASAYLQSIRSAAGTENLEAFDARMRALYTQELPRFAELNACGHCGKKVGPAALQDHDFFDFQAYVYGKALLMTCCLKRHEADSEGIAMEGATNRDRDKCLNQLRVAIGDKLIRHIFKEIEANDAEAAGIAPGLSISSTFDDLFSESPELPNVRQALRSLFKYLRRSGVMYNFALVQAGMSYDEYENFMTWEKGEPAYLKYWLAIPADLRSAAALQSEEGAVLGPVSTAIAGLLNRCGVEALDIQRIPSLTEPIYVAEQWTLRRRKPLPKNPEKVKSPAWKPDPCLDDGDGCYV